MDVMRQWMMPPDRQAPLTTLSLTLVDGTRVHFHHVDKLAGGYRAHGHRVAPALRRLPYDEGIFH